MNIKDILNLEEENANSIILHREGIFWKAYVKSAYLFVNFEKEYISDYK